MVEETTFRGVVGFLDKMGFYDVILPFLLVFTIVFAILEKTRIFGTEELDGVKYTRKNINSIVAFVIAFLVIFSTRLVAAINKIMANIIILLLVSFSFLLLIGSFFKEDEDVYLKEGPWRVFFMLIMFVGVLLIFLHGFGWLTIAWDWLIAHWQTNFVATIVLLAFIFLFMIYIVQPREKNKAKKE